MKRLAAGLLTLCLLAFLSPAHAQIACPDPFSARGVCTPITGVFSGADTTTAAATLAGTAGKTTYICSVTVSGLGATAATPVTVTVATLAGGNTMSYSYVFPLGATVPSTPLAVNYNPCIPAGAAATAITVTVPGAAGNTATQINATGYQL
jgi:hypothetical protein